MSRVLSNDEIDTIFSSLRGYGSVALAVSGGGDSTALMLLAREWVARQPGAPSLTVLTVDHGLRPSSRRDAEWVAQRAGALGLACHILNWDDPPSRASQAQARSARYDLLTGFVRENGIKAVVTAHTRDDVAETFLMRLARGSGLDGLAAMEPQTAWKNVMLLRPLLGLSREQLRAELEARGADWLDDPSNVDPHFERVRVRSAMPVLQGLGITPAQIAESAARLRRARLAIHQAAAASLDEDVTADPGGYLKVKAGALERLPEEVAIGVVGEMLRAAAGRARPPRLRKLEMLVGHLRHVSRVSMTLGGCVLARARRDETLTICREPGRLRAGAVTLTSGASAVWDGRFRIAAGALPSGTVAVAAFGAENIPSLSEELRRTHPSPALASLPAIYAGDVCLGVPVDGYQPVAPHADVAACRAEFLWPVLSR